MDLLLRQRLPGYGQDHRRGAGVSIQVIPLRRFVPAPLSGEPVWKGMEMGFAYLTNVPLEQAKKEYLRKLQENGFGMQTETIAVQESYGRITSRAVYARINVPHYAAGAMGGYTLDRPGEIIDIFS